jgi:hypothetical protein
MTKLNKEEIFKELKSKMRGMDLPDHRKMTTTLQNVSWLRKNMSYKNSSHPKIRECEELCDLILSLG